MSGVASVKTIVASENFGPSHGSEWATQAQMEQQQGPTGDASVEILYGSVH